MRQTSRDKQLRPMFDSLDYRIAPASVALTAAIAVPVETGHTSTGGLTTSITVYRPAGSGGSTTKP